MAKKKKRKPKCDTPNCLFHKFWPSIEPAFHPRIANYWVDPANGELMIATGLKVLSDGEVTLVDEERIELVHVQCTCGTKACVRADLLHKGFLDRCPECAAASAEAASN
jgi:hypothetical protein